MKEWAGHTDGDWETVREVLWSYIPSWRLLVKLQRPAKNQVIESDRVGGSGFHHYSRRGGGEGFQASRMTILWCTPHLTTRHSFSNTAHSVLNRKPLSQTKQGQLTQPITLVTRARHIPISRICQTQFPWCEDVHPTLSAEAQAPLRGWGAWQAPGAVPGQVESRTRLSPSIPLLLPLSIVADMNLAWWLMAVKF